MRVVESILGHLDPDMHIRVDLYESGRVTRSYQEPLAVVRQ